MKPATAEIYREIVRVMKAVEQDQRAYLRKDLKVAIRRAMLKPVNSGRRNDGKGEA